MINRIYIDNYKCFSDFEIHIGALLLLLGENGTGKTTVFAVLHALHQYSTLRTRSDTLFPAKTLTSWRNSTQQKYVLEVLGNGGTYTYTVIVDHDPRRSTNRVVLEEVHYEGLPLYQCDGSNAFFFRDDGNRVAVSSVVNTRSSIASLPYDGFNQRLKWFYHRMQNIYVIHLDPLHMTVQREGEASYPNRYIHELLAWARYQWQVRGDIEAELLNSLREVIFGLQRISFRPLTDTSTTAEFQFELPGSGGEPPHGFTLPFDQLSDGQRRLVVLYLILYSLNHGDVTVCLDEPDNYVTLRELQPWLNELRDRVAEKSGQCLLISHHPEAINLLAAKHGLLFYRDESGPVRTKPFEWTGEGTLLPSEIIARGWE